jgi:hypothetical protein
MSSIKNYSQNPNTRAILPPDVFFPPITEKIYSLTSHRQIINGTIPDQAIGPRSDFPGFQA